MRKPKIMQDSHNSNVKYRVNHSGNLLNVQQTYKDIQATTMKLCASANGLIIEDTSRYPQLYVRDELRALLDNNTSEYKLRTQKKLKHLGRKNHQILIDSIVLEDVELEFLFFTHVLGYIQGRYPHIEELYLPVTGIGIKNAMQKSVEELGNNFLLTHEQYGSSVHINRRNGNHLFEKRN